MKCILLKPKRLETSLPSFMKISGNLMLIVELTESVWVWSVIIHDYNIGVLYRQQIEAENKMC